MGLWPATARLAPATDNYTETLGLQYLGIRMARRKSLTSALGIKKPSLKRALGVTKAKRDFARLTGIPTSKSGMKRKGKRELQKAAGCCIILSGIVMILTGSIVVALSV